MAKDNTEPSEEQPKHPGGRPLKFATAEQLEVAINAYFDSCDPHVERRVVDGGVNQKGETIWLERAVMTEQKPYTLSGLARALGVDRKTIKNYGERDGFFHTVEAAVRRCEEYWESALASPYSNGAKFNLSNNYADWREKQEIDHTTKGRPMPLLGGTTPLLEEDDAVPGDDESAQDQAAS